MINIPTNVGAPLILGGSNEAVGIQSNNVVQKGEKVKLDTLEFVDVGLGWDTNKDSSVPYDLDVEAFMLKNNGGKDIVLGDDWFVFYGQPVSPDGSIVHSKDNKDGAGSGDDEVISVHLSRVHPAVEKILFVITIDKSRERGHNFGGVKNAYVRMVNKQTNEEVLRFNLTDYYTNVTSMVVCEIYRYKGEWKFNAVGDGMDSDLKDLCIKYGVNVE